MPEVNLPDISLQWAQGGDILKPSDSKIQQGWGVEIPPRQWFNWLDNRQDQAIAHIAQHGISVWSANIEYQANKSYVQGSDGIVYKSTTTHTGINPVGDSSGTWQSAFLTAEQAVQVATAAQSRAMTANNVYLSPLQLANAFTGSNQSLGTSGYQRLPGGVIIQWMQHQPTANNVEQVVNFPTPFSTSVFSLSLLAVSSPGTPSYAWRTAAPSATNYRYATNNAGGGNTVFMIAIGI